jgi:hypothetical protein
VSYQDLTTVAILGRNRMASQALELLLRGADCDARFLGEPGIDKLGELLDGVQLLLLGPALSAERRENLLDGLRCEPGTANIPVLELISTPGGTRNGHGHHVMWPCKTEELVRHIGEVLLNTGHLEDRMVASPSNDGGSRN